MIETREGRLVWVDLEMTGLDPDHDTILEIAIIVTDDELVEIVEGPVYAIAQPLARLEAMDDWNQTQHRKSGLWDRVLSLGVPMAEAERRLLEFLSAHVAAGASPMCGSSICQDRRFLARHMPALERYFHYRNLDVSTVKELARRWAPDVLAAMTKVGAHTALSDIRESIAELRHYRRFMGRLGGKGAEA